MKKLLILCLFLFSSCAFGMRLFRFHKARRSSTQRDQKVAQVIKQVIEAHKEGIQGFDQVSAFFSIEELEREEKELDELQALLLQNSSQWGIGPKDLPEELQQYDHLVIEIEKQAPLICQDASALKSSE